MFGQVVQGTTTNPAGAREAMERWVRDLSPGAVGWLGTTAGVTRDGTFIAVVRFDSDGAARANSDRPELDQWWAETCTLLDGEVTVTDGVRTELYRVGDPNSAGFCLGLFPIERAAALAEEVSSPLATSFDTSPIHWSPGSGMAGAPTQSELHD